MKRRFFTMWMSISRVKVGDSSSPDGLTSVAARLGNHDTWDDGDFIALGWHERNIKMSSLRLNASFVRRSKSCFWALRSTPVRLIRKPYPGGGRQKQQKLDDVLLEDLLFFSECLQTSRHGNSRDWIESSSRVCTCSRPALPLAEKCSPRALKVAEWNTPSVIRGVI